MQHLFDDAETIDAGQDVAHVFVLHRLNFSYIEGDYFENFLFDSPHIKERAVVHYVESVIVSHDVAVTGLIFPNLVDSSHLFVCGTFFGICVFRLLKFCRDFLAIYRLAKSCMKLWNYRARGVDYVAHATLVAEAIDINHFVSDNVVLLIRRHAGLAFCSSSS